MQVNLDKYKEDLKRLVSKGDLLHLAMQNDCFPAEIKKALGKQADEALKKLP